jgi:hypothetical protein
MIELKTKVKQGEPAIPTKVAKGKAGEPKI